MALQRKCNAGEMSMRLKRRSLDVVSLLFFLLGGAFVIQSGRVMAAATRTVGVHVGDWAEYSISADGNATG